MGELFRRLRYLLQRRRFDRELADDLEFHREMAAREGRALNHTLNLREQARDAWGWAWLEHFAQDLRYAARTLARSPGFTLSALAMLAVGIGVNVAVFGFFDLIYLRQIDVRDPATLLRFHRRSPDLYAYSLPVPEMAFFREHTKTLSAVMGLNIGRFSVEGEGQPVEAHFVTTNFFSELGAGAELGRTLLASRDDAPDAEPSVVLSHGFWQRHYGGNASVVGTRIEINGKPAIVVGVAPRSFCGLSMAAPAFWGVLQQQPYFVNKSRLLTDVSIESPGVQVYGRLAPGMNPKAAEAELAQLAGELRGQYPKAIWDKETLPGEPAGFAASLRKGNRRGSGTEGRDEMLPIFGVTIVMVLLILSVACANLGSLLLARGVAREREISIRLAVGAGSGRLVRQLFTESLLLALLGSFAGLATGYAVLRLLMSVAEAPPWLDASPDWRVTAFALAAGCGAAVVFGLMPALQIARRRHRGTISRQVLIGAQVAASCVLLILASLLGRALDRAVSAKPGFEYQKAIALNPGLGAHGYTPAASRAYLDSLVARLQSLPGVESVSLALCPPLGRVSSTAGIEIDGRRAGVSLNRVDPQFLDTMKIPLLRGRNLQRGETSSVVISESLARALWPAKDPLGLKFPLGDYTIVGVAANARTVKLEDSDSVEAYLPIDPGDLPAMFVVARTSGSPADLARAASAAARSLDPGIFPEVQLIRDGYRRKLDGAQSVALAVASMGAIAHFIACLGIFGVVAYAVSQRTREIGIRLALGAEPGHVLRVVLRRLLTPVSVGMILGTAAAFGLSGFLRGQLFGISHLDPTTYGIAIAIFLVTVAAAAWFPARRALRIDPWRALRHD
jgi:predicted permease